MALIDPSLPAAGLAPQTRPAPQAIPHAALARLAILHGEAGHDLAGLRFLARAPQACLILMAAGTGLLAWQHLDASNTSLEREFVWALSVLTGIAAMTGLHIRGYAQGASRIPLHRAVTALRRLLFYTGAAWGSGALLLMPASPLMAIVFAAAPGLAMTILLGKRAMAFTAPVILATAGVACLGTSGPWVAAAILAAGLPIVCLPMLQREMPARRDFLPASRAL